MPTKHILTRTQLESLTSPTRLAIVQRLEIDKAATIRELAQRMGRSATGLYHHVKKMEDIGLIRVLEERKGPRRPEAVYAMVADCFSSAEAVKTVKGRNIYGRAGARVADAGARAFIAAMKEPYARFDGTDRNAMVRFFVLRADKKKISLLNRLLHELERVALQPSEEGEEIQLTVLLSPLKSKA